MVQPASATSRIQSTGAETGQHESDASTWWVCAALVALAAVPRFVNLTGIGFHGDEDITAFAVRSALETGSPQMPSGMPYLRGLLYTWMTALSVGLLGSASEMAYRLPSVVFGVATVPLLYLTGRRLVGHPAALAAAVLLAVSSWHIYYSQHARMYATFLFLFLAATFAIFAWQRTGRKLHLGLAAALSLLAVSVHLLGMLLAVVLLVPYLTGRPRVAWWASGTFAALAVAAALAYNRAISVPYRAWRSMRGLLPPSQPRERTRLVSGFEDYLFDLPIAIALIVPVAMTLLGLWVGWRWAAPPDWQREPLRPAAIVGGCGMAGMLVGVGQIYGAVLSLLIVLILATGARAELVRRTPVALAVFGTAAVGWAVMHVLRFGAYEGLKAGAAWPFALPIHLTRQFPVPMLVFVGVAVWLAWRGPRGDSEGLRRCVLITWLPLLALGFVTKTEATRYLLQLYPFILLTVGAAVVAALNSLAARTGISRPGFVAAAAAAVALSGLLSGHGMPQAAAVMRATPAAPHATGEFPWYPDHRTAARWLAARHRTGDVVIGEDPLALRWYGVHVDYWLRRVNDARAYLYRDDEGVLREFYGNSELLADTVEASSIVSGARSRVWLVTSGETHLQHGWYLSAGQRAWLDALRSRLQPAHTAGDGVTRVYCLNCEAGEAP